MWFCSSPFGSEHHSALSSRVLMSCHRFFIIRWIGDSVRGASSSWRCCAAFGFSARHWNTSFQVFIHDIWMASSSRFYCRYPCLRSIITLSGSSELALWRLPSRRLQSEKCFKRCVFTKLKSDLSSRCCANSDLNCVSSASTQWSFTAAERLLQAG